MALTLVKVGTSAGVGAVDLLAEYIDEKQGYTKPFQNLTDWGRVVYSLGGYGANYMKFGSEEITESMVVSSIPLLEKSLLDVFKVYVLKGKGRNKGRMGLKLKRPGRQPGNVRYI